MKARKTAWDRAPDGGNEVELGAGLTERPGNSGNCAKGRKCRGFRTAGGTTDSVHPVTRSVCC